MNSVETDTADVDPPSEQTPVPAAALTRFSPPGLPDDNWNEGWIMTHSSQASYPAQQEFDWTEFLADSGAAEHVCSEHHFPGAPIRPASRVVLRIADGTEVVTDCVTRVRLRTENGEKVMVDVRSASVTHPILSASGMSKRGIQAVLGHKNGYLEKGSKRLDLTCRGDLYFLRAKMENEQVHDCAPVMRDEEDVPMRQDGDEDGDVEEPPEDAGVDDDEGEDAVATEMRGPDEPTNTMRKHHQLTHIPFLSMV